MPTVCVYVYLCVHPKPFFCGPHNLSNRLTFTINHSFNSLLGSWSCAQDLLFWPWIFLDLFHKNLYLLLHIVPWIGVTFVDPITHWIVWHWPSIMVSTVNNGVVFVHKTYCFNLDLSLMLLQTTSILSPFYNGCSTKRGGFDLVCFVFQELDLCVTFPWLFEGFCFIFKIHGFLRRLVLGMFFTLILFL